MTEDVIDVPSPIDFADPVQARAWVADTVARRPARPRFFAAFNAALNAHFNGPFGVAELGSGPGHLAASIIRGCDVKDYAAIDLSPAMHDLARAFLGADAARVTFIEQDFRGGDWVTAVGPVDAVVTLQAAHEVRHKARLPALFADVFASIRPSGVFLYCDHHAGPGDGRNARLHVSRAQQPALLANAGFSEISLLLDEGGMALYSSRRPGGASY